MTNPQRRSLIAMAGLGLPGLSGLSGLLGLSGLAPRSAHAQTEAIKPVKIIVPFSPGGGIDILGRAVGQKLNEQWNVAVVVDNRPGASGNIGTEMAAKSPADGSTCLMTANTLVITPNLMKNVRFDPVKDFIPVAPVALGSLALVTRAGFEARNVKELIALAKAKPGAINYGSPGNGTPHHLAMELFKSRAKINALHVPYKGSAGLVADLLAGQVDIAFLPVHQALPSVKAGKLVMLAAGGSKRASATPDVPSLEQAAGIADIDVDMWYGMYLPAGTPADIVARFNKATNAALQAADVRDSLISQGLTPTGGSSQDLATLTRNDLKRWHTVIQEARLQAE